MSEFTILKVTQGELVSGHELQPSIFRDGVQALMKWLALGLKPVVVIQSEQGAAGYRTVASPLVLVGQTRAIAHWVCLLSKSNILSAQLVVERCKDGTDHRLLQTVATIKTLTDLGVIPVLIHNELTWVTGRSNDAQWDIAERLAISLNATIEVLKPEQEQVMESDHIVA